MPPKGAKKDKDKAAGAPKDLTGKHGEKTPAQLQADEDAKSLRRQARALGVISARSAGDNRHPQTDQQHPSDHRFELHASMPKL